MSNLVKIDLTEYKIEPSRAKQIEATFAPMVKMLDEFETQCADIYALAETEITADVSAKAKRTRLDIAKVRISADKVRKEMKEESLRQGNAIQGAYNVLLWAVQDKENRLKEIEEHQERLEEQRIALLQAERVELIAPYVDDAHERNLGVMDAEVWDAYYNAKKKAHEDLIEAQKQAELDRLEAERKEKLRWERAELIRPYYDFFTDDGSVKLGEMLDADFDALLTDLKAKKDAHIAEQKRIAEERARLEAEAKKREAEITKERAKAEEARLKAEIEANKRLEVERKERERLQAEIEAKKQAEIKAEEARKAEAEKLAKAPIKAQLSVWVNSFEIAEATVKNDTSKQITEKFTAFKKWAQNEIERI